MNRLMHAYYIRIRKYKLLWIGLIVVLILAGIMVNTRYKESQLLPDYQVSIEGVYTYICFLIGIISAVYVSCFVGTEYSDGTIRNKIGVGFHRNTVYLSNYFAGFLSCFFIMVIWYLFIFTIGNALIGSKGMEVNNTLQVIGVSILMLASCTAINTAIAMNYDNKTNVVIIEILFWFAFFIISTIISRKLAQPELIEQPIGLVPNEHYVKGTTRKVYELLTSWLPTGQVYTIVSYGTVDKVQACIGSIVIIVVSTVGGMCMFQKKNIK